MKRRKRRPKKVLPLSVDADWLPRLDRIATVYGRKLPGAIIRRTHAARAALFVGMAQIEQELGITAPQAEGGPVDGGDENTPKPPK
jgi:hypothetical protein